MIQSWMYKINKIFMFISKKNKKMKKKKRPTKKFVVTLIAIAIFVYFVGSTLGCTISFQ